MNYLLVRFFDAKIKYKHGKIDFRLKFFTCFLVPDTNIEFIVVICPNTGYNALFFNLVPEETYVVFRYSVNFFKLQLYVFFRQETIYL